MTILRSHADMAAEIVRLRALLRHADDVVIWEHTHARSGFQEEIEAALGIGAANEQPAAGPPRLIQGALDLAAQNARLRARIESARVLVEEYDRVASIDHVAAKAILWRLTDEQSARPIKCEGCDTGIADPPSRLCPGCQAYVDHQR